MSRSALASDPYTAVKKPVTGVKEWALGTRRLRVRSRPVAFLISDNSCSLLDVHGIFLCSGLS